MQMLPALKPELEPLRSRTGSAYMQFQYVVATIESPLRGATWVADLAPGSRSEAKLRTTSCDPNETSK